MGKKNNNQATRSNHPTKANHRLDDATRQELISATANLHKALNGFHKAIFAANLTPSALQTVKKEITPEIAPKTYFLAYILSDRPAFMDLFWEARADYEKHMQKHNRKLLSEFEEMEEEIRENGGIDGFPDIKEKLEAFKIRLLRANKIDGIEVSE